MSEPEVSYLLTVTAAIDVIDAVAVHPRVIAVPLGEAAGLVLAEELRADRDFPPFDKSLMDGFAVRAADVASVPASLLVRETIAAGASGSTVSPGTAAAIMTGAPMPAGADAVVPVEYTSTVADCVTIARAAKAGQSIAPRGSDCRAGEVVLPAGVRIGPAQIAVAAAIGAAKVSVFAKPRVAVLSTGDEIVLADQTPGPSQIRNSNGPMMIALLQKLGCETIDLGHVPDEPETIRQALRRGLESDALFVTGGMSMGQFDYVPRLLRELEVELKITKLRIKPGKPFVFGVASGSMGSAGRNSFVFGLPGNPVSAFVCTLRLAARLLNRLAGEAVRERWIDAELQSPLPANGPREFYQPAKLVNGVAIPLSWKGSADLFTLAKADAFLVRPENEPALPAGARVRLLEIPQ